MKAALVACRAVSGFLQGFAPGPYVPRTGRSCLLQICTKEIRNEIKVVLLSSTQIMDETAFRAESFNPLCEGGRHSQVLAVDFGFCEMGCKPDFMPTP